MKNDLPDVSVIVPIFKVEKYIERCVRSLFEQSLDNIEYIFVDDASPDDSVNILLKLIQEYPSRSQNVKIIRHSKNRGLAMARSTGFLKSTGRYIIHCDSDDWVEQEMYEVMYQTAIKENADIVVCDFIAEYLTKHVYKIQKCALDKVAFVEQLLCGEIHNGICNKLINRKLYSFLSFHWKTGCNMWEDVSIIPRLAFFATKIAYVHEAFYHYSQENTNAYTRNLSSASIASILSVSDIIISFFEQHGLGKSISLSYFKLRVKYSLLNNVTSLKERDTFRTMFPESNYLIFSHPIFTHYQKLMMWSWIHKLDIIPYIISKIIVLIKKNRRK